MDGPIGPSGTNVANDKPKSADPPGPEIESNVSATAGATPSGAAETKQNEALIANEPSVVSGSENSNNVNSSGSIPVPKGFEVEVEKPDASKQDESSHQPEQGASIASADKRSESNTGGQSNSIQNESQIDQKPDSSLSANLVVPTSNTAAASVTAAAAAATAAASIAGILPNTNAKTETNKDTPIESVSAQMGTEGATLPNESESKSITPPTQELVVARPRNEYIPPPNRKLSPETIRLLNSPAPSIDTTSPVDLLLLKVIGTMLKSSGFSFSEEFVWRVSDLTSCYLHELVKSLHKFTELQRKTKPSKSDVELLLKMKSIKPNSLYSEYEKSKEFKGLSTIKELDKKTNGLIDPKNQAEYTIDEPSLLFFTNEHYEITELVPKKEGKPSYVPSFLPDLPPDYTYQKTPKYMDRITDLKEMRLKLVEESRMTEKSLYNLIDDDEVKWKEKLEQELAELAVDDEVSEEEDSVMSDRPEKHTDVESVDGDAIRDADALAQKRDPANGSEDIGASGESIGAEGREKITANAEFNEVNEIAATGLSDKLTEPTKSEEAPKTTSGFDIVAYAQKRLQIRLQNEKKAIARAKLREQNIFIRAETLLSPYSDKPITEEVTKEFQRIVDESFKKVIYSVRASEKHKKRKIELIMKEREARERERAKDREQVEFGFNFGNSNGNLHDDDDDDDDDASEKELDMEDFPEFNFPTISNDRESTAAPEKESSVDVANSKEPSQPAAAPESTEAAESVESNALEPTQSNGKTASPELSEEIGVKLLEESDESDEDEDHFDDIAIENGVGNEREATSEPNTEEKAHGGAGEYGSSAPDGRNGHSSGESESGAAGTTVEPAAAAAAETSSASQQEAADGSAPASEGSFPSSFHTAAADDHPSSSDDEFEDI